jgi:RNA polymerase sigma-32 factor
MDQRMKGPEASLNATITGEDGETEWQDWVVDENADQELQIAQKQEKSQRKQLLDKAIVVLNEREKEILFDRQLNDEPKTLEELSQKYKVSRERIRQIENRAFEKLQKEMLELAKDQKLISAN